MSRRKRAVPAPSPRVVEDPVARQAIVNLRAGLILPPEQVAGIVEQLVLELEDRDRVLARIRNRVDVITMRFPEPFDIRRYLPERG